MSNASIAIIALVAALSLLGLVMVLVANNLSLQEAEAQSGTHSQSCEEGRRGASFQSCVAPRNNPSNPNSICNDGREFGANLTGSNC